MRKIPPSTYALITFLFLVCIPSLVKAQNTSFAGHILNKTGKPVANAEVVLNHGQHSDITDSNGAFLISNIKGGKYTLAIRKIGFKPYTTEIEIRDTGKSHVIITLESKTYGLEQLVVTATKTPKKKAKVAVPVTIISKEEVENTGSVRLSDILAEQTGLMLVADHGLGLQMQGLESDYTLIMINGQPIVGRTSGTLNLDRISISNVKRIEIIRGPSSSLYGSDALAGVVNIITEKANDPFKMDITGRYGTHQTMNLSTNVSWATDNWHNTIFIDRYSSGGYRLINNSISQTVPKFHNYTLSYRTDVSLTENITAQFYGRYYKDAQDINSFLGDKSNPILLNVDADLQNYSLNPSLQFAVSPDFTLTLEHYLSGYKTNRILTYRQNNQLYDKTIFDETLNKTEMQGTLSFNNRHTTTFGAGYMWEKLHSLRYAGQPKQHNLFIYGQHEWQVTSRLNIVAGFRYDNHSEYADQFSPKFSAQYEITDWLRIQASTGRGFKAPGFRQLYLNFTNPTAGYSVFGASTVVRRVHELQAAGKISRILIPLDQIQTITAERSWSYNAGIEIVPSSDFQFTVNAFRNNLANLIQAIPIAIKTNGESVYAYFNRHNVYTEGINMQFDLKVVPNLRLSLGYQYLIAKRKIKETRTVQDQQGNPLQKTSISYQPLFNRSKHSGTFKLFYTYDPLDIQVNIRGTYRNHYGFIDNNGNGYVNTNEYTDGYMLWNAAFSKTFAKRYRLQAGIDNLFDVSRPGVISYLSGRLFYLQLSIIF